MSLRGRRGAKIGFRCLPLELYGAIIQHVNNIRDLHRLLFVSHTFHNEALCRLYRHFPIQIKCNKRHLRSLRALSKNPIIANQLRFLNLQTMDMFLSHQFAEGDPWIDHLPGIFHSLDGLKTLRLPVSHPPCFIPPASVKFRLEGLCFTVHAETWPLVPMISFLGAQDTIHTLEINSGLRDTREFLPSSYLPNLFRLCVVSDLAQSIVSRRSIRFLYLFHDSDFHLPTESVETVEFLTVEFLDEKDVVLLGSYFMWFPNIRYLEINIHSWSEIPRDGFHPLVFLEVLNISLYTDLSCFDAHKDDSIAASLFDIDVFPRLRQIEYSAMNYEGWPPDIVNTCRVLVKGKTTSERKRRFLHKFWHLDLTSFFD